MDTDQVLQEYQDQYHEIMKKHGLDTWMVPGLG